MSLSSALNNAKSGLSVNALRADLIARNVSNAETEGYTRKTAKLATGNQGGVYVASVDRNVDSLLDRINRNNIAKLSAQQTVLDGMKAYTDYLGQPEDGTSPVAYMANLNSAMVALSAVPYDRSAQVATISAARELVRNINDLSGNLSSVRNEVELNIRYDVSNLNSSLQEIGKLNRLIVSTPPGTTKMAEYEDRMGQLLDKVAGFADIQTVKDKSGMISVLTTGGTELVVGQNAYDIGYDSMTGRLTAGDVDITPGGVTRAFEGGSLAGLFTLRNETIPEWSAQLDLLAASMIEGFEREAPIGASGLGLFTDNGGAFDSANIAGMASRLRINSLVNPDLGGDPSLLQKGTDPARPEGDDSVIRNMIALFNAPVGIPTGSLGDGGSLSRLTSSIVSMQQKARAETETATSITRASASTVSASRQNLQGVNIDDELISLQLVEQSQAANARCLNTVVSMMDTILEIV